MFIFCIRENFEEGFNPDLFLQTLAKFDKKIDDIKAGKFSMKTKSKSILSVRNLLRYKKTMSIMEPVLEEMSKKPFFEK